ncbi:MAG TPA: ROK family transcriptional regulator [Acidobacteriaceae bacterium]|nr:ROK family transcriptional regulator [Acidobacteriaceae bacterium]
MVPQTHSTFRTASNKMPRRVNTRLILDVLRKHQPVSRVDLARLSGLQPSTVSLIVEELVREHWLEEGEFVKGAMGRRPRLLSVSHDRCVIAIDIHPRQTTLAVVDITGTIVWQGQVESSPDPDQSVERLIAAVRDVRHKHADRTCAGIGICVPGRTDPAAEHLIFAPNLHWPILALKSRMQTATGLPVHMDNVANACALLEVWQSQNAEPHDLVVVEVSEGLGTGLYINGAIARGRGGMAGEFGHIPIEEKGIPCSCGNRGCWETVAAEPAAIRYYCEIVGRKPSLSFPELINLAATGDRDSIAALRTMARQLGKGMQMIAAALAPAEIIVVGDCTAAWDRMERAIEQEFRKHPLAQKVVLRPGMDAATARLRSAVPLVLTETLTGL